MSRALSSSIAREVGTIQDVLYCVVLARKVYEVLKPRLSGDEFWLLKFFLDWPLHARLAEAGAQRFIRHVGHLWRDPLLNARAMETYKVPQDVGNKIGALVSFHEFRRLLREMYRIAGQPDPFESDRTWAAFIVVYCMLLSEPAVVVDGSGMRIRSDEPANPINGVTIYWPIVTDDTNRVAIDWRLKIRSGGSVLCRYESTVEPLMEVVDIYFELPDNGAGSQLQAEGVEKDGD